MGDPRRIRKKYETPRHPWIASRIEEEKKLRKEFGTKNKKEIWKMASVLKKFKDQAKILSALNTEQAKKEQEQMINKMVSLGLVNKNATLDNILSLTIKDIMNRRLQTIIVKKLMARTVKQARQMIVHGHITVGNKIVTSPSYLVTIDEESQISFTPNSPYQREDHPERFSEAELATKKEKKEKKEEKEEESPTLEVNESDEEV